MSRGGEEGRRHGNFHVARSLSAAGNTGWHHGARVFLRDYSVLTSTLTVLHVYRAEVRGIKRGLA